MCEEIPDLKLAMENYVLIDYDTKRLVLDCVTFRIYVERKKHEIPNIRREAEVNFMISPSYADYLIDVVLSALRVCRDFVTSTTGLLTASTSW